MIINDVLFILHYYNVCCDPHQNVFLFSQNRLYRGVTKYVSMQKDYCEIICGVPTTLQGYGTCYFCCFLFRLVQKINKLLNAALGSDCFKVYL